MKRDDTSILLIARTPSVVETVGRAVGHLPKARLNTCNSGLVEMNGHAARLASGSDLVIFETGDLEEQELGAIRALVGARDKDAVFVAVTDGNLPIAKARLLSSQGVDEILPLPCSEEDLAQLVRSTVRRGAADSVGGAAPRQGSIIAVARARGGIGATTIAVNLGYLLQDRRGLLRKQPTKRVALVDLELQFGNVGIFLDVEDQGAMLEIAKTAHAPDATFVRAAMGHSKCGLAVLPAPAQPIPLDAINSEKVSGILDALRADYDYVIVDMPHALVPWIAPVLDRAGKILIATDTTVPGVRHARRLIDFYTEDSPGLPIDIAVVREGRPIFLASHQREAAKVLERPLAHWLPHDTESAVDAMDRGTPLVELRGGSKLSRALRRMTQSVARSISVQPAMTAPQF